MRVDLPISAINDSVRPARTILFVDDEVVFLELVERLFRLWSKNSFKILTTHSVGKAISLLQDNEINIIVTDIRMPVVDGIQFLKLLHRKHPNMKKVVLTGLIEEQCRATCLASGASLFMEKPRDSDEMESVYAAIVELANMSSEVGFSGVLKQANLGEMVQMLCLGGNSVIMELKSAAGCGEIYISKGAVLHATATGHAGIDAFYYLMSLNGGEFSVKPFSDPPSRTISGSWEKLLLESARQTDELAYQNAKSDEARVSNLNRRFKTVPLPMPGIESIDFSSLDFNEAVSCSASGEILGCVGLTDPAMRADLLDFIEVKGRQITQALGLGALRQLSIEGKSFNAVITLKESCKSYALSEQRRLSVKHLTEKLRSWEQKQKGVSV